MTTVDETTPPPDQPAFGARALQAMRTHGPLCLGLDPTPALLAQWQLGDDIDGLRRFCAGVVTAATGRVAVVKPQSAYFERFGPPGLEVLQQTLADLREAAVLTLLDVKRGDIPSTTAAYAQAHLGPTAPVRADAVTLSPYLGFESLRPALDLAAATTSGVFVLALTSNPEGPSLQHVGGPSVATRVAAAVAAENTGVEPVGSVGLVIGATVGTAPVDLGIDLAACNALLLAPGVGAQGGTVDELRTTFGPAIDRVLPVMSRSLLQHGPDPRALGAAVDEANQGLSALATSG